MPSLLKIAGAQMDVKLGEIQTNLTNMKLKMEQAAEKGAQLIAFPECATTGYCFESLAEAKRFAEPTDGPSIAAMIEACKQHDMFAVFGYLELDGDRIFNGLAMTGPEGLVATYRKIHLPTLGVDQFTTPGDRPFQAHEIEVPSTGKVKIGLNICYDCSFPESSRLLALDGADLIVLPTNWPPGAGHTGDYVPNARALENHVFYMSVNRVGVERGFEFIGKSKIVEPNGGDIHFCNHTNEELFFAEIDVEIPRNKRLVRVPNKHEIDRFRDRRPDVYGRLADES